ncbi:MAG: FGGY family carbohydrate kinase [bacterium]
MAIILGIDIGTQSVKTGIFGVNTGDLLHISNRSYQSGAFQSPDEIWNAALDAVSETIAKCKDAKNILAIGLSGQMHGTVIYDKNDNILTDIINWQDETCNQPLARYGGRTTIDRMLELMGTEGQGDLGIDMMSSGFMGATLFYLMENNPELFARIEHVLPPTDFIRRRLIGGGDYATDPTNAFATGVFNTRLGKWHEEIIQKLRLPLKIFPDVVETTHIAGNICSSAAHRTGLKEGTPVVTGGGDNLMAIIGSGAYAPGSPLCINIGTSSQVCAVVPHYIKIDGIDTRSFIGGNFALVYAGLTGGKCYTWLRNILLDDTTTVCRMRPPSENIFKLLDRLAEKIPPGCDGLQFTPTLRGTRRNPSLRGDFTGIGENNFTLAHRARAVMEGVVKELHDAYTLMKGVDSQSIVGAGNGLASSELWCRITAEIFNMPLKIAETENAVRGAAIVAAVGIGVMKYDDIKIKYSKIIEPT